MDLAVITLPQVELPFVIDVLLHPIVVHFMIAFPVMVLFLEIMNILINKKTISGVNIFLLLLTIVLSVGVYFTGIVDSKESIALLTNEGKNILEEHKVFAVYIMIALVIVFLLKLISVFTGQFFKVIYIFSLFILVGGLLKESRQGEALVYTYGYNVQKVEILHDKKENLRSQNKALLLEIENLHKDKAEALQRVKILQGNIKLLKEINTSCVDTNISLSF